MGLLCAALANCKKPEGPKPQDKPSKEQTMAFNSASSNLFIDETVKLGLTVTAKDGSAVSYEQDPTLTTLSVSPAGIVELDINDCSVKAVSYGKAVITAKSRVSDAVAEHTVYVMNPDVLKQELNENLVVTSRLALSLNSTIQGFDILPDEDMAYWSQIGVGTNNYTLNVSRRDLVTGTIGAGPQLYYAGHGQGLAIEKDGDDYWCWLGTYGTLGDSGYVSSQTVGRFKFARGMSWLPEECDNYWIPERRNLQVSLDQANDIMMIYTVSASSSDAHYYGYRLSEMKKIVPSQQKLSFARTYGGVGPVSKKVTDEKSEITVRNLAEIAPEFYFTAKSPLMACQGYAYDSGKIFLVTGVPDEPGKINNCQVYIMDTKGNKLKEYDLTGILNYPAVTALLGSDLGFFEPEGIQVKDGCIYIGFGSRITEGKTVVRKPVILKYNLASF